MFCFLKKIYQYWKRPQQATLLYASLRISSKCKQNNRLCFGPFLTDPSRARITANHICLISSPTANRPMWSTLMMAHSLKNYGSEYVYWLLNVSFLKQHWALSCFFFFFVNRHVNLTVPDIRGIHLVPISKLNIPAKYLPYFRTLFPLP